MTPHDSIIRNFCIIAHVDHGKSTLADRLLELTGTVPKREMHDQLLDQMDIERERGITIKLAPVAMRYRRDGREWRLNLIDTPGHVDFSYEVSRSLAAVEGAVLLVDASQGVQAQTVANYQLARQQGLTIVPAVNKIDLEEADVEGSVAALAALVGDDRTTVLRVSAKTGEGVAALLDAVVDRVPPPPGSIDAPLTALIFDSWFDDFRGVVAAVRVTNGMVERGTRIRLLGSGVETEVIEVGTFTPKPKAADRLIAGEIGYVVTGLKSVQECRVGDTMTDSARAAARPLAGYAPPVPMVFAGIYPAGGDDFGKLRQAIEKLQLNDASFQFQPERSDALGFGFRCGFLGLLHLDIVRERLNREYGLDVLVTAPSVGYRVTLNDAGEHALRRRVKAGTTRSMIVRSPLEFPSPSQVETVEEPWMTIDVVCPAAAVGSILQLVQRHHGIHKKTEYAEAHVDVEADVPLTSLLSGFYDTLKAVSSGYASMRYTFLGYRAVSVRRLDVLVAGEPVEALATIVREDELQSVARRTVERLKELVPTQLFEVKLQAAVGGKVIAAERISARRKDVTAKLYGGDVTRKRKLLEKQKAGKARLKAAGRVALPTSVYVDLLRR